jgi:adenylate cyclase class 2
VDTADRRLSRDGTALRVRADGDAAVLTFKGPVVPGPMKTREEIETSAGSADVLLAILASLGYVPVFRYEKFREEFALEGALVAIDDTPIGAFLEIEGEPAAIERAAERLGFGPADYVTASYRTLFAASGPAGQGDMLFTASGGA